MNLHPLILQIILSRLDQGNPVATELIARMAPGLDHAATSKDSVLAQLTHSDDPTVSLVARQLIEQQTHGIDRSSPIGSERSAGATLVPAGAYEAAQGVAEDFQDLSSAVRPLDMAESATAEVVALRSRLDNLAYALGACVSCWGSNGQCHHCRGRGKPGSSVPDKKLFTELVLPAIRILKASEVRSSGTSTTRTTASSPPSDTGSRAAHGILKGATQ